MKLVFSGGLVTGAGFGVPGLHPATTSDISFTASVCVGKETSGKKTPPVTTDEDCLITGWGTMTGHCGQAVGSGTAQIHVGNNDFRYSFSFTVTGGVVKHTGSITKLSTGQSGVGAGKGVGAPDDRESTGSCATGSETFFLLAEMKLASIAT